MSTSKPNIPDPSQVLDPDSLIDDLKEEVIEAKDNLLSELKTTLLSLGNSIFGDFKLFTSILRTVVKWFLKPTILNVHLVEQENLKLAGKGLPIKNFTDISLMKSIFMLSLTFLVIEESAIGATQDQWIDQGIFFLFFSSLLFLFVGVMWLWKLIVGFNTGDARVFTGFLIYQFATIYIVSFIVNGPLGLSSEVEGDNLILIVYGFQLLHSIYFLNNLCKYYQLTGRKKVIGLLTGAFILIFFLFTPQAITEVFLVQGISSN